MVKMSILASQALASSTSQSDEVIYQEGSGYLNDRRLESFGHLLADYVLHGATFTIDSVDKKSFRISEGIISFSDQLWRSFSSEFRANLPNTTYYVGFAIEQGYVFGPTEPNDRYMRLWTTKTDTQGNLGTPVDYRGPVGKVKYKALYDGVYLNTAEVQAAINNAINATANVTNVLNQAEEALADVSEALTTTVEIRQKSSEALTIATEASASASNAVISANAANTTANATIVNTDAARVRADTATSAANTATTNADAATTNAINATNNANVAAGKANSDGDFARVQGDATISTIQGVEELVRYTSGEFFPSIAETLVDFDAYIRSLPTGGGGPGGGDYVHPDKHPPSIIEQNSTNRFVTDAQITNWNAKETVTGSQTKATQALADAKTYTDQKSQYIYVDDFAGATDSAKIQAAINFAATGSKKVVKVAERYHELTSTIVIKKGVELRGGKDTQYSIEGNIRGFELEQGASIIGGFIGIGGSTAYSSEVIYLDGKHQYDFALSKTVVKDLVIMNWTGIIGGTALSLYSGGTSHHIQFVNFQNLYISHFQKGISLKATDPGSGMAWVNANRFDKITIEACTNMIVIDSLGDVPAECSGNVFTNIQIQPNESTMKVLTITGNGNHFSGVCWDLYFIPHQNPVIEFLTLSSNNDVDFKFMPVSRVVNHGNSSNNAGMVGMVPRDTLNNVNWNSVTKMGAYTVAEADGLKAGLNHPISVYEYGILTVFEGNGGVITQWYHPDPANHLTTAQKVIQSRFKFGAGNWSAWSGMEILTAAERTKLAGIATGANNYTHPANHPASIITQNATNRFVTDAQIAAWNAKQIVEPRTSDPASPVTGQMWIRTDL